MLQHHTPRRHHAAVAALLSNGGAELGDEMAQRKALDFMLAGQPHPARAKLESLLVCGDRRGTTLAAYIVCLSRTGDGFRARGLLEALQRSNVGSAGMTDLLGAVAAALENECRRTNTEPSGAPVASSAF